MHPKTYRKRLHAALLAMFRKLHRDIEAGNIPNCGICDYIYFTNDGKFRSDLLHEEFKKLYREWPGYSGVNGYPIKLEGEGHSNNVISQYLAATRDNAIWTGENGEQRRKLLTWTIEQLENAV